MDGLLAMGLLFEIKDGYSAEAQNIQKTFNKLGFVTDELMTRTKNAMNNMQTGLMGLGVGAAITAPFALAVNSAMGFEKQMSAVKSVMAPDKVKLYGKELENLALKLGKETAFSAVEAANGMEELTKAGLEAHQIMDKDGLAGALDLATAGELDLASAAEVASTALNAFKKDNMTIRQSADILAGAANASATSVRELKLGLSAVSAVSSLAGFSFKETNLALAVLAQNGLKGSDAGTSLKTMLMNLSPKTKSATEEMQRLGLMASNGQVAFFNAKGEVKSMAEISNILQKSLGKLNPKQQTDALEKLFGSDAIRAGGIMLKEGAEGFNKMSEAMGKITAAQVAKERLNNFAGALTQLNGSIETAAIIIGTAFLPILKQLVSFIDVLVSGFAEMAGSPIGAFLTYLTSAFGLLVLGVGGYVFVTNLAIFASMQASVSFAKMGHTAIATAFATNGLAGGLLAVTKALIPLIAKVLLLALPVIFLYKSFTMFSNALNDTASKAQGGFLGFMQKVGAVIWAVGQAFSSWNGKTFDLGGMEEQLKKLGVFDLVLRISAYTVRFIEFMKGFASGISDLFIGVGNAILQLYNYLTTQVSKFLKFIGLQNATFKQNTASMEQYAQVGKVLGYVVGTVLLGAVIALTWAMGAFALSVIAAMLPFLPFIALIGAIVAVFYYWNDITKIVSKSISFVVKGIYNVFVWLLGSIANIVLSIPSYFASAFSFALNIIYTTFFKIIPFMVGVFARLVVFFVTELPVIIGNFVVKAITVFMNFGYWLLFELPKMVGSAFVSAMVWAYNSISYYITAYIGLWYSFGSYLITNVPIWISNAFTMAYNFLFETLPNMFSGLGDIFYNLGKDLMDALWNGLKSIWESVQKWGSDAINSFSAGFNVFGTSTQAVSTNALNPQNMQSISNSIAQEKAQKPIITNNTTNNETQTGFLGGLVVQLDGQQVGKILEDRERLNNARR
jgi:TP901 family phage tail tape measure protein